MAYEDFIGLRYLMAKRRSRVVSIITLFAVAGVALGVTALIVVLSVMGGFKKDLKQKILGTKAHIVVRAEDGGALKEPQKVAETARGIDGIVGAAPFVAGETMASSPTNLSGMMLRGIPPERIGEVSELESNLSENSKLEYLSDPNQALKDLEASRQESIERLINKGDVEVGDRPPEAGADDRDDGSDETTGTDGAAVIPPGEDDPEPTSLSEALADPDDGSDSPDAGADATDQLGGADESPTAGNSDDIEEGGSGGMPPIVPGEGNGRSEGSTSDSAPVTGEGNKDDPVKGMTSSGEEAGGMPSITGDSDAETTKLPGVLLGVELASSLSVDIGDELNVVTPQGEMGPTGPLPQSRPFVVVGTFKTGMYEYDANFGYTHIRDAQDFFGVTGATGIELKAADPARAMELADKLQKQVPDGVEVEDWKEMNRSLFFALQLEKIGMFLMLTLIVIVASFSIIAMLIMIVLEKSRDISILKSLGVDRGGIMRIFMFQGVFIGTIGAAIGLILGLGICWALIEFGFPLNSEVYYIKTLPVDVQWSEVVAIVVCTIIISFLATLYPSLRAASLRPVEGLRYE